MFDWFFRDRQTGELTLWQTPNARVMVATAATVGRWASPRDGTAHRMFDNVAVAALALWGVDELARGASPYRRVLGAGALISVVTRLRP